MHQFLEKHFRLLAAIPIVVMLALQIGSVWQESATFDEGVHLAAGYRYWRTGSFKLNVEHPPLQKLLSAAPLLVLQPPIPAEEKLLHDQSEYARVFLYQGPLDADRLLLLGRIPTVLLTALLAVAVAWAARRHFGAPAALTAVWLCALDPNLIAHGRYITTDMASALLFFLTVVLWVNYLLTPSRRWALWAGLALGLALSAKFSMILLLPLLPSLVIVHWLMARTSWRVAGRSMAVLSLVCVGAAGVVLIGYGPESWRTLHGRKIGVGRETIGGVTWPPHTYLTGIRTVIDHNNEGHPAFLLGSVSETGWWYYFPVVFAVKSPTALLPLLLLALPAGLWRLPRLFRDPAAGFPWIALLLPPLAYFGVTLTSHINLGVRHLLPVYPFLYVLCAAALQRVLAARVYCIAALAIVFFQAGETVAVFPEYLGYFNLAAGGRKAGPRYLLDSNVDWGQDLKKLKTYIDRTAPGAVCLDYFGSAEPKYYGIQPEYLPRTWDRDELERMDCVGAISVTLLRDLYIKPGSYAWLRERTPIGAVGSSIYLYDLRKPKQP
ncbi:MAG: ArnT family glycosyltransferase [Bryobacteraceae bacterium]